MLYEDLHTKKIVSCALIFLKKSLLFAKSYDKLLITSLMMTHILAKWTKLQTADFFILNLC